MNPIYALLKAEDARRKAEDARRRYAPNDTSIFEESVELIRRHEPRFADAEALRDGNQAEMQGTERATRSDP